MHVKLFLSVVLLALAGCSESSTPAASVEAAVESNPAPVAATSIYEDAVASSGRTDSDRERDAGRKPAQVLEFFAIEPGMTVLDMFSGGGYYTEMLSNIVGTEGKVVAHSNKAYADFLGDELNARYADGRLVNVEMMMAENNELELPADTFDVVMMVLAYHDIYYVSAEDGWPKIDGPKLLAEFLRGLKSGGTLAVVDHYAAAGSPRETGGTLHRIDPSIVIAEIEAAGFVLDGKSDIVRNMEDDHSLSMYDEQINGKTDRFVMKFRKP
ncbi:MAG: methyltransferase type 11 [Gammaproteobacteria bacterium]|nr:MAG: methyltransferase type 11 [Gammaproteobacteria bacterium]RLA37613.1 MAG: methyltransferase type 11 [Gammaproteobacteria bacterium]